VVLTPNGLVRQIPVAVTDRAEISRPIHPFPLDLSSVRQLLATFERILAQLTKETADEFANPGASQIGRHQAGIKDRDPTSASVVATHSRATATDFLAGCAGLSEFDRPDPHTGEQR
jgi:hypothetical protein